MSSIEVTLLPIFNDNYVFVIEDRDLRSCVVVDPGDAQPVQDYLEKQNLILKAILITHHHDDHIGGALELKNLWNIPVYAPLKNKAQVSFATNYVVEGDLINLLNNQLQFKVMELPGHTLGHVVFFESARQWLFSGDVLFGLGCGRLFEGTFTQAYDSLQRIKNLPDLTKVFCTHEYTEANLKFCKKLTSSSDLKQYEDTLLEKRTAHLPSVPLNLGIEKKVNPFLASENLERFSYLRELRNRG